MKNTFRFFGLLDILGIFLTGPQIWLLITHFQTIPSGLPFIISLLRILVFLSLFVSAGGLILKKRFGVTTYYIQFVFRFITLIFSFGFVTYLNDFLGNTETVVKLSMTLAVFGEFLRLYYTYRISTKRIVVI